MPVSDLLAWTGLLLSIVFGVPGIVIATKPEFVGFFRIRPDTTGMVFVDRLNIEQYFQRANSLGFATLRDRMFQKIKLAALPEKPIIVCPAEVDYILPFLLAAKGNWRFCTINTNAAWDSNPALKGLHKERYSHLLPNDCVILCLPVITTGEFLRRVLDYLDAKDVRIVRLCCAIDASGGAHAAMLRQRNLDIDSVYCVDQRGGGRSEDTILSAGA